MKTHTDRLIQRAAGCYVFYYTKALFKAFLHNTRQRGYTFLMAGGSAHYDKQSLTEVQAAGETARQKEKLQRSIEKPQKEIIIWYVGIAFSLFPVVLIAIGLLIYKDNVELYSRFIEYLKVFFDSGSFLWFTISLLFTSLTNIVLFGKRNTPAEAKFLRVSIIVGVFSFLFALVIYFFNVIYPINVKVFRALSIIIAALFGRFSYYFTVKLVGGK